MVMTYGNDDTNTVGRSATAPPKVAPEKGGVVGEP